MITKKDAHDIETWFEAYTKAFFTHDAYVCNNLKIRYDHIMLTRKAMVYLCQELNLSAQQCLLGDVIALLHDIGRFEQFSQYRTFSDHNSVNHGCLGVRILANTRILSQLSDSVQKTITSAIQWHNARGIPHTMSGEELLFTKLIRDADKIDIYRCSVDHFRRIKHDPAGGHLELEVSDAPHCSDALVTALLQGQQVDYSQLQTYHDLQLMQLGWIYDINFVASLKHIHEKQHLNDLIDFLPTGPVTDRVRNHVYSYLEERGVTGCDHSVQITDHSN